MSSTSIGYTNRYPSFQPDPTASLIQNFSRLALEHGWKKKSSKYKEEKRAYLAETIQAAFLRRFGDTVERLEAWQSLCSTIGVSPRRIGEDGEETEVVLGSIEACKKALKGTFVNLVDLVEAGSRNQRISITFRSRKDLARYIRRTEKTFPLAEAKKNPLLKTFLIVVGACN